MRALTRLEIEAIRVYDLEHMPKFRRARPGAKLVDVFAGTVTYDDDAQAQRRWMMRNRYFYYLTEDRDGEIDVRTVAVRYDRAGRYFVKEVIRANTASDRMELRDISFRYLGGYVTDWHPEGLGRLTDWNRQNEGVWGEVKYERRGMWRIDCAVINPELLEKTERWKWCAWRPECGDVLSFLKLYAEHPRIEMLVKIGLPRFASMRGFVKQLERDREFLRFVSRHAEEIRAGRYGADDVRKAYRAGVELVRGQQIVAARRSFHGRLPLSIDAERARAYIRGQRGMSDWDYCQYLRNCKELGQDFNDTKVIFPRQGHRRMAQVQGLIEAQRIAKDKAARKNMARDLKARAERFGAICERVSGGMLAYVPGKESEFKAEGKALHHCVGTNGYALKMAQGECVIVFIRSAQQPDRPFFTAEIRPSDGRVIQCYGEHHARPPDDVHRFVEKTVAPAVARIAKREAAKAAKKPASRRVA